MKHSEQLPIQPFLPKIVKSLKEHNRFILQASPGAGKSTMVPLAVPGRVLMLQPRRMAARSVARRMAFLLGEKTGETIGYHIRHDLKCSRKTRVRVVTEGMLVRYLVSDPFLEQADTIILDEFHERSIHSDLALALILNIQEVRPDLKLLVMSATLDHEKLSDYLENPPALFVPRRQHPLTIEYQPCSTREPVDQSVLSAVEKVLKKQGDGDILVFLSGAREIQDTVQTLKSRFSEFRVLPFYSALSAADQDHVFNTTTNRRIICATNIAETSLTIPGITAVIDSGWRKNIVFDPASGLSSLKKSRISKASADQRAGRAGRLGPGHVIRLWSVEDQGARLDFDVPEIMRSECSSALLHIINQHGSSISSFRFYEKPPEDLLNHARSLLTMLGALSPEGTLTGLGKQIMDLPLDPRNATMLCLAEGRLKTACLLCALLEHWPLIPGIKREIPLLDQLHLLEYRNDRWSRQFSPSPLKQKRIHETYHQLWNQAKRLLRPHGVPANIPEEENDLIPLIMAGYPDRLCILRDDGKTGIMASGRHVSFRTPIKKEYALAVVLHSGTGRNQNQSVELAIGLNWGLLQKTGLRNLEKTEQTWFDDEKEQVVSREVWTYGTSLVVRRGRYLKAPPETNAAYLSQYVQEHFERVFELTESMNALLWRLRFAAKHMPEESWPDVSTKGLINSIPEVCGLICSRKEPELAHFKTFNWSDYWLKQMTWDLRKTLEKEVPASVSTPCGKKAFLDYKPDFGPEKKPVFKGIIQHLFGLNKTPVLAKGRVEPLIHILGPNRRVVQVTSDLAGFWKGSYQQVRKELKGRYPKHDWPETPGT